MNRPPEVKSIRIEYESGEVHWAEGPSATELWEWLIGCEQIACIHGFKYNGPQFIVVPPGATS